MRNPSRTKKNGTHSPACEIDQSDFSTHDESEFIRKRAYNLFEARGHEPGYELQDWLQAEQEIRAGYSR